MTRDELHHEAVRVSALAKNNGLMVKDDGGLRAFLPSSEQQVGQAWDRICHSQGEVWVEAWGDRYLKGEAEPRYLKWEEIEVDETTDPDIFMAGDFSFWSWKDTPEWIKNRAPQNGDDITYCCLMPVGQTINTTALRLFDVPDVFVMAHKLGLIVYGVHA